MNIEKILKKGIKEPKGYQLKDIRKFRGCNKLIARGHGSSGLYAEICEDACNFGDYDSTDVVGVSVNGKRSGRLPLDKAELRKACEVGAMIIGDNPYDRNRRYNVGEKELETALLELGYEEMDFDGIWVPGDNWNP